MCVCVCVCVFVCVCVYSDTKMLVQSLMEGTQTSETALGKTCPAPCWG